MKQMMLASLAAALLVSVACTAVEPNVDTPSPTATNVQILDDCPTLPCEGPLEPGAYRWTYSEPTIDFEIPSPGWKWHFSGGGLHFIVDDTSGPKIEGLYVPDGVYMLYDPTIASRDCEDSSEPGVGRSLSDLVAWLGSAPGLVVSESDATGCSGTGRAYPVGSCGCSRSPRRSWRSRSRCRSPGASPRAGDSTSRCGVPPW